MMDMYYYGLFCLIVGAIVAVMLFGTALIIFLFINKKATDKYTMSPLEERVMQFSAPKTDVVPLEISETHLIISKDGEVQCEYIDKARAEYCLTEYYNDVDFEVISLTNNQIADGQLLALYGDDDD